MSRLLAPVFRLMTGLLLVFPVVSMSQTIYESPQTSLPDARGTPDRNVRANAGSGDREPRVALDDLINVALVQNPAIKSAAERLGAQRAQVPQARSLPDPKASVSWMGNITPFSVQHGDPSSYRGLTVGEQFPYPGKLKLRGQIADRGAEAAWWDYEQMRRQVIADVKAAYYSYYYDIQAITITEQHKDLLQKLESIAEALYRVGKGIQQDVLRAQVEVSRIEQRLIVLRQQEQTARARINTLLYRDPESPLPPPAPFSPAEFHATLAELYALGRQNDPGIEMDRRMIERNRYAVDLARKAYDPDFSVEYNYFQRPGLPDMHGFMVGINIPVFYRTKQREGVIEASHNLMSTQRDLDNRMTSVNFDITQQYLAATASRDLSNLYSKAIVPQSSLALESSMSAYEVGKLDFLSMLGNLINVLDYEVNYYQELTAFQTALSRLEPLVGAELTK